MEKQLTWLSRGNFFYWKEFSSRLLFSPVLFKILLKVQNVYLKKDMSQTVCVYSFVTFTRGREESVKD